VDTETTGRLLDKTIDKLITRAKIRLKNERGIVLMPASSTSLELNVQGSFYLIDEAADAGFKPQHIVAKLARKKHKGEMETYGSCVCAVTGNNPPLTFEGALRAPPLVGDYVLCASYMGCLIAEHPITIKRERNR
jgi:hypothetical protein